MSYFLCSLLSGSSMASVGSMTGHKPSRLDVHSLKACRLGGSFAYPSMCAQVALKCPFHLHFRHQLKCIIFILMWYWSQICFNNSFTAQKHIYLHNIFSFYMPRTKKGKWHYFELFMILCGGKIIKWCLFPQLCSCPQALNLKKNLLRRLVKWPTTFMKQNSHLY
jgi:hypothetical protein